MRTHGRDQFTEQRNWTSIFLWSLIPAIVFVTSISTGGGYIDMYDEVVFWISSVFILLWGIFVGLVSKNDIHYRYSIIRNAFTILFFSIILLTISVSLWVFIVDHIQISTYNYKIFATLLTGFTYSLFFIAPSFFFGYTVAKVVSYTRKLMCGADAK